MKKTLPIFTLMAFFMLLTAGNVSGQGDYHIQEGFSDNDLPAGWLSNDNISMGDWSKIPNQVFTDQAYGIKLKVESPVESWVQLPGVVGVSDLSFWILWRDEAGNLDAKVQTSTDGETWTDFAHPLPGVDKSNTDDFQEVNVSMDIDGPVYIRVLAFTDDGAGAEKSGVYVDDFQVGKKTPAADDVYLTGIMIDSVPLQTFDFMVTEYDSTVTLAEAYGPVTATANNPNATVDITQVSDISGSEAERTATIVVTGEDQSTTATTTIVFTQTDYWYKTGFPVGQGLEGWDRNRVYQDDTPNYPSSNKFPGVANIKFTGGHSSDGSDLHEPGHLVSPKLPNLDTLSFWASAEVVYPEHELNVYIKTSDEDSTLVKSITGQDLTFEWQRVVVPIESEDSVQIRINGICDINNESDSRIWMDDFLLTYYEPPVIASDDATLSALYVGGTMVDGFSSDVTSYTMDVTPIMDITVTAEATDEDATVNITQATNIDGTEAERTATVEVTSADESTTTTTTIVFTNTTAVEGYQVPEVVYYPNPATDRLNIQVNDNAYQKLEIFNIAGQKVRNTTLTSNQKAIDIANLSEGLYIISFTGEAGTHLSKFIKE
ncbi:MAG TPA: T9SS type A sorting domain-containing protein [Bacteroidales bacterium]|nr:T9SS type A sorting domain-containing protein [Bacteroidales bacterium]